MSTSSLHHRHAPIANSDEPIARVMEIEQHVSSTGPCVHSPLKELVLHGSYDGSSPLLLACEEGHLDAVQRILNWGTDINAAANFYHHRRDGCLIEEATPLFVASLIGHIQIVRYLISKSANVSSTTHTENNQDYDGLTPLHGAFISLEIHSEQSFFEKCAKSSNIARLLLAAGANPSALAADGTPVWMRYFCGVEATIALVNHDLNLQQRNLKGETILHSWIEFQNCMSEEERLGIIQLLADRDSSLMMARDNDGFTPILRAAQRCNLNLLDWMLKRPEIDRREKIDAVELTGSCLLMSGEEEDEELSGSHLLTSGEEKKGFDYWRIALQLRAATEERDAINKDRLPGGMAEWVTLTELENIIKEPWTRWIQCMLTQLRVYSTRSLAAVDDLLRAGYFEVNLITEAEYVWFDSSQYIERRFQRTNEDVVTLLKAYLEVILKFHPEKRALWMYKNQAVDELIYKLPEIQHDDALRNSTSIKTILELILAVDPDHSGLPYNFFEVVVGLPEALLNQNIRKYLIRSVCNNGDGWLTWACQVERLNIIRILLHLGADPNPSRFHVDYHGNGPLHRWASMDETPTRSAAANLLFYYGANPNQMNYEGETAADIWMKKNCGEEGMRSVKWNDRPDWCRDTVPKLSRLCVKTVHIHGVPFDEEHASLPPFRELPKFL